MSTSRTSKTRGWQHLIFRASPPKGLEPLGSDSRFQSLQRHEEFGLSQGSTNSRPTSRSLECFAAFTGGILAAGGATAILVSDAVSTGNWTLETKLAPVVIVLVIVFGYVADLLKARGEPSGMFRFLMAVGVAVTIYFSVGRQSDLATTQTMASETSHILHDAEMKSLIRNKAMLEQEQSKLSTECASGGGTRCTGIKVSIEVYQNAIAGNLARMKELGPQHTANPSAEWLASVAGLLGGNADLTRKLSIMFAPLMLTVLFELAAVGLFGVALHSTPEGLRNSASPSAQPSRSEAEVTPTQIITQPAPVVADDTQEEVAENVIHFVPKATLTTPTLTTPKSTVAMWVESLPVGQKTRVVQREVAESCGVTLRAAQKALQVLADGGVVKLSTTPRGTTLTRLI